MKAQGIGSFSVALLAVAFYFGGPHAVRAENPEIPGLQEMIAPIMRVMERLAQVEAAVGALASSLSSKQATAQELCVADASGQTCITKAQLDALLRMHAQMESGQQAAASSPSPAEATEAAAIEPAQPETGASQTEAAAEPATATTEDVAAAPAQPEEPSGTEAAAPAALEQPQDTVAIQAELDQLEQALAAQAGLEQPEETVAKEVQEIIAAQKEQDDSLQLGAAPVETTVPESHDIAAARVFVQEDQEPVVTGSMSSSGASIPVETSGAVEMTPPEDISPPETLPAAE